MSAITFSQKKTVEYISRFGFCETLHPDQGANVHGAVFQGLWFDWGGRVYCWAETSGGENKAARVNKPKASTEISDTKYYGQPVHAGDQVWCRNWIRVKRKKFFKPWCGTWRVIKAPLNVTYPIKEWKKPGKHWQRRVVHLNYLKLCHTPPQETLSASFRELGRQVQIKPVDSTEVETMAGSDG